LADRRLIFVYFDGCEVLDFAGPLQAFHEARGLGAPYSFVHCGASAAARTAQGLSIADLAPLPAAGASDLILVPGFTPPSRASPEIVSWLRKSAAVGATVASICTGALLLASAGLLRGRRCTTHWKRTAELQERCRSAQVLIDRLFVEDGPVISSAGIASGIDLALALIERHHGALLAAKVAREMVVYLRRDAARIAGMSPRSLTRAFRALTGITLHEYRTRLRLERARTLMSNPELTLEAIAGECGFADARQLRRVWADAHQAPPSRSRRTAALG
jgi:transcriptional regulator GlxA family with amidase domain